MAEDVDRVEVDACFTFFDGRRADTLEDDRVRLFGADVTVSFSATVLLSRFPNSSSDGTQISFSKDVSRFSMLS